jgi:hypothetical protein
MRNPPLRALARKPDLPAAPGERLNPGNSQFHGFPDGELHPFPARNDLGQTDEQRRLALHGIEDFAAYTNDAPIDGAHNATVLATGAIKKQNGISRDQPQDSSKVVRRSNV